MHQSEESFENLVQLFEKQVKKTPNNIAVIFRTKKLTYQELNQKANQLAHHLRQLAVHRNKFIGICLERGFEMIISILAVLKAGGAYVPLDPDLPKERLDFMLQDAKPSIIITQSPFSKKIQDFENYIIYLDAIQNIQLFQKNSTHNLENINQPNDAIYVIYTSGSTGQPKGVINNHNALSNRLLWMQKTIGLTESDRVLQKTPFTFDVSFWEFIWPLIKGAALIFIAPKEHKNPKKIKEIVIKHHITTLHFVPSLLGEFLQISDLKSLNTLKNVICSGETLPIALHDHFFKTFTSTNLYNMYGPTEAAIDVTSWKCHPKIPFDVNSVPIGKPIDNIEIFVVTKKNKVAQVYEIGELYIGGIGLARGYHNRPELTAQKFIKNSFSNNKNSRIYKTGDLVKQLPDGNLEFIGRTDHQVKIRGFRIELGEIENVLMQSHQILHAIVSAKDDQLLHKSLIAYLTAKDQKTFNFKKVRKHLIEQLPDYMIPEKFILLDRFPLNINGKIDRKQLEKQSIKEVLHTNSYTAPKNDQQKTLQSIWIKILDLPSSQIGIHDSFFELGGNSLSAIQLAFDISSKFSVQISLEDIFTQQTIDKIDKLLHKKPVQNKLVSNKAKRKQKLLLATNSQKELWSQIIALPNNPFYNEPSLYSLKGNLDVNSLKLAFKELIKRHIILRSGFSYTKNQLQLKPVSDEKLHFQLPVINVSTFNRNKINKLILEYSNKPFELSMPPLFRAVLFQLNYKRHYLLISFHHIITDEWSQKVVNKELNELYSLMLACKHSEKLASLKTDTYPANYFSTYNISNQKQSKTSLDYWIGLLKNIPPLIDLPFDKPRPLQPTYKGARVSLKLPSTLSENLVQMSVRLNYSLFALLLSIFSLLLHRYTQQSEIVIGIPSTNRQNKELEKLIGFYVNLLPLNTRFDQKQTFKQLVKKIQKNILMGFKHQDISLSKLTKKLKLNLDSSYHPLFQTLFVLQDQKQTHLNLKNIDSRPLKFHNQTSKFDLTLIVNQNDRDLELIFEYATDLFEKSTIERLAHHYRYLAQQIILDIDLDIEQYSILSPLEQKKILIDWNKTEHSFPNQFTLHQLFEHQVKRTPHLIAVNFGNVELTYDQLNCKANQLAHHLRKKGIRAGSHVAIFAYRGIEIIISILASLKSGAAYIPIDPTYPQKRLKFLLKDSQATLILTHKKAQSKLLKYKIASKYIICIDQHPCFKNESSSNLKNLTKPHDLAYMIYTSGSTGNPKGVMVEHQGIVNTIHFQISYLKIKKTSRILGFASISFDASVSEIFCALLSGATYCIVNVEDIAPINLIQTLQKNKISVATISPAILKLTKFSSLPHLKTLIVAGDICPIDVAKKWGKNRYFINGYGPTEASICSSMFTTNSFNYSRLPIGKPIYNTKFYVLDKNLNPLPIGAIGELHVAGIGLARGYFNNTKLSREKFIPNPFDSKHNLRLYKTGDFVRWLPDGNIDFIERRDNQIKLNGIRIELQEIESILLKHPSINTAAVKIENLASGHEQLVAYITTNSNKPLSRRAMTRNFYESLRKNLPFYMLPSKFILVEKIPLSSNGKMDKKLLKPEMGFELLYQILQKTPLTSLQKELIALWEQVLGKKLSTNDINTSFFALGGDSLQLAEMLALIKKKHLLSLDMSTFLNEPTISLLEKLLQGKQISPQDSDPTYITDSKINLKGILFSTNHVKLPPPPAQINNILLTGATGFIGSYILKMLLTQTHLKVYCLIRANKVSEAKHRLASLLKNIDLEPKPYWDRIEIILGDLSKPQLNLNFNEFKNLGKTIDSILHAGAMVHHIYDYNKLRTINVLSLIELLKLATIKKLKCIHYLSTLSVLSELNSKKSYIEDFLPTTLDIQDEKKLAQTNGYIQSKWVAELLLAQARQLEFPINIFRPSLVLGDSHTGKVFFEKNHFLQLIKGCIQMGYAPNWKHKTFIIPVDCLAKFITDTILTAKNQIFNISGYPIKWHKLIKWINKNTTPIKLIAPQKWQEKLKVIREENVLFSLTPLYLSSQKTKNQIQKIKIKNTLKIFKNLKINKKLLKIYFDFLAKHYFK